MSTKKHAKSKFFRVAVEGATTDGRVIARDWITQMAKNYNPDVYGARINLEHYRGIVPDGPFKAYGDVTALEAREETGVFAGKLGLYAEIIPTDDLVTLNKAGQKIYTSCEVDPSFADTKQAYLVGLAITDSPASLGTSVLSFAAGLNAAESPFAQRKQRPENLFTAADLVDLELEETTAPAVSLFARVGELLGLVKSKGAADETRFADVTKAVETVATFAQEQAETITAQAATITAQGEQITEMNQSIATLSAAAEKDREEFAALKTQLSNTGDGQAQRPPTTGGNGLVKTDC